MSSITAAINEFGLDLFKELLRHNAKNNIFFSPFSIVTALSMVYYGSRGDSATQMRKVLHFNEGQSVTTRDSSATEDEPNSAADSQCDRSGSVHSQFQALLSQLSKSTKHHALSIASGMYAASGFEFLPHYLNCIEELYHARLETVDFAKETEKTRLRINKWIDCQTRGKIKEFYPQQSLSPDSVLVLVNAVSFRGIWEFRFKEEETKEEPFWVTKDKTKNVPMMFQKGKFKIADLEDPPLQVLELPFEGKNFSMIILLPKDSYDLEKLERSLTYKNIEEWISKMSLRPINVHLPRYKIEERYGLKPILESMGITDVFDPRNANLSGMSKQNLVVSQVTQQAFVEVNESGTKSGAATSVRIIPTAEQVPIEYRANRPFLFVILDGSSKSNFLFGKYSSP